jgi:hypothetical protein
MAKASDAEEEYFARENAERLRKLAAEQKKALADTEREKLRQLHQMHCPKCGMELKEIGVRGVQVDRCFSCNGTWLDAASWRSSASDRRKGASSLPSCGSSAALQRNSSI